MLKEGSTNISASSRIGEIDVIYFNASFSNDQNGSYTISKNVMNAALYNDNQAVCDEDYALFEEMAKELAAKIQEDMNE